jgi:hypothetical protein
VGLPLYGYELQIVEDVERLGRSAIGDAAFDGGLATGRTAAPHEIVGAALES